MKRYDINSREHKNGLYVKYDAVEAELSRLRAEVATLVWNLGGISTLACRREVMDYDTKEARPALNDVAELVKDYARLRAANAELVEVLRELQRCAQKQGFNDRYETTMGRVQAALSRAEQAKPETCVWSEQNTSCNAEPSHSLIWFAAEITFCPFCGKRIEVAGKAEGRQG